MVEFPAFFWDPDAGRWDAAHHPFTAPTGDLDDPASLTSRAYDLVLDGAEIGGGSIRIHEREVQERVFELLGIGPEEAQSRFGFLLDALRFGAPPHGGIAMGVDRIVSALAGTESIRDVIAFPEGGERCRPAHRRAGTRGSRPASGAGPAAGLDARPATDVRASRSCSRPGLPKIGSMDSVSRPLIALLLGTVAVFALWLVALKPSSSGGGAAPPRPGLLSPRSPKPHAAVSHLRGGRASPTEVTVVTAAPPPSADAGGRRPARQHRPAAAIDQLRHGPVTRPAPATTHCAPRTPTVRAERRGPAPRTPSRGR